VTTLARWCLRHRLIIVVSWFVGVVVLAGLARAVGSDFRNNAGLPGTDSQAAFDLLHRAFPSQAGDTDTIVWRATGAPVTSAEVRGVVEPMLDRIAHAPHVVTLVSPYAATLGPQVSADGHTAFATLTFDERAPQLPPPVVRQIVDTARAIDRPGLQVELTGAAISSIERTGGQLSEGIGLVAAAVILLLAFGSLFGMLMPIIAAVFALGAAIPTITLLSHVIAVAQFAPELGGLIGLGVGIDYALFILTRHRRGLQSGHDVESSIATAMNTSGRAVLFAGGTVCIAMLGMFVLGVSFLYGVAVAASLTVVFTMAASVTLLPALLGFLGPRVLSRRERRRLAAEGPVDEELSGAWLRWARWVDRHPAVLTAVALAVMATLMTPYFFMRLGSADQGNEPTSHTSRRAYDLLAAGFGPGFNGPLLLAADLRDGSALGRFDTLVTEARGAPGVAAVSPVLPAPGGHAAIALVYPTTSPQSVQTADLLHRLRGRYVPVAERGGHVLVHIGGTTAVYADFATVLSGKIPIFVGVVVALSVVLLVVAFRSLAVPLTGALMNLLSAAAGFGIMTAVFQFGWGASLFGVDRTGPIEPFLPVMLFAILFGLSMDYQVFLVSRMHEEWRHTGDNQAAITRGQAETGRVITAAAMIMVAVFVAFISGGERVIEEIGLGLATAIALDALVIRTVLVPAAMHLFGRWNWWLPRWLDRIVPHVAIDPPEDDEAGAVGCRHVSRAAVGSGQP
jgi:RND superfamily putative drug exporter